MECYANIQTADAAALLFDEVAAAKSAQIGEYTIVATLPKAIFTLSERKNLKTRIRAAVAQALEIDEEFVLVSFDTELFRKIDAENVTDEELINLAKRHG